MSICRVISWVVGKGYLLLIVCSFGKTLLAFAFLHFSLHGQSCLSFWVSLNFLLLCSNPCDEKDISFFFFFLVLVPEGLVGLHRMVNLSFFEISGWGIALDCSVVEWFALEKN